MYWPTWALVLVMVTVFLLGMWAMFGLTWIAEQWGKREKDR